MSSILRRVTTRSGLGRVIADAYGLTSARAGTGAGAAARFYTAACPLAHRRRIAGTFATQVRGFAAAAEAEETGAATKPKKAAKKTAKKATKKNMKKKKATAKATATEAKKAKKKAPRKKLSPEDKKKLQVRALKKVALLKGPSKQPEHPWIVYVAENLRGTTMEGGKDKLASIISELSQSFKVLSETERSRLSDEAIKNREANKAALKAWVESHTPTEIADANRARAHLNRLVKTRHRRILDERQPKRPLSAFSIFTKDQWLTGDYASTPLPEVARSMATMWKELSPSEREKYESLSKEQSEQYGKEVESVLGRTVHKKSPSPEPSP